MLPDGAKLAAMDTETYVMLDGLMAPPLVCVSWADADGVWVRGGDAASKRAAVEHVRVALMDPLQHIGGCNLAYDLCVLSAYDPTLIAPIFAALDEGRLHSTDILEPLHDNARGLMFTEPTGRVIVAYSQELLEARYLGLNRSADKHGPDAWRLRYGELDDVPVAEWPQAAVDYPKDDAKGALELLRIQLGLTGEQRHNLQCAAAEMRAAYALQLLSCWGIRTDPALVANTLKRLHANHEKSRRYFATLGVVRVKTASKDDRESGKVDDISDEWLVAQIAEMEDLRQQHSDHSTGAAAPGWEWVEERISDLRRAHKALGRGKTLRFAVDTGRLAQLVTDAYQGDPPLTETGRVSTARDTLVESDDETLLRYAKDGPGEKHLAAFAQVLQQGTEVPINPSVNVMVSTQRVSMREPNLMQLPRGGGIRECFVPRNFDARDPADRWVLCSVDYGGLELATLAQVCYHTFGHSLMRDALNEGQDLHLRLAASMSGITYAAAQELNKAKDKGIKNKRQAAKPVNFGLPGKMGAAALVRSARNMGVRFCELLEGCPKCGTNSKVTSYKRRAIAPTCTVCLRLAEGLVTTWRETWPEMVEYLELTTHLADACERGEPIESFGDGMLRLEASANSVSNHFFQNLAAQGAKRALYRVQREAYDDRSSVLYGNCRPVVFVHDEIVSELREEVAHECAQRVSDIMIATMRELCPDVRITAPPAMARRWFKGMEAVYTKAEPKRMRPWWPTDDLARKPEETEAQWLDRAWAWGPDRELMLMDMAS